MVNKNILDNLTGQEIKEMIYAKNIELEKLNASALRKLMDYEIDMICLGNGDEELVSQCALLLNELDPPEITREDLINIIDKTGEQYVTVVSQEAVRHKVPKKRGINKRTALFAAVLAVTIIASALVSCGVIFDFFEYLAEIAREPVGTQITVDGFTFYHSGESKEYSSIEEMIEKENLDIMYPTKWPEGARIERVSVSSGVHGNDSIAILTNHINVSVHISICGLNNSDSYEEKERVFINNKTFYIFKENDYYAYCYYKDNSYSIRADSYDNLILILENLKEK